MREGSRSRVILAAAIVAILVLTAASSVIDTPADGRVYAAPEPGSSRVVGGADPASQPDSIAVSRELFRSSRAAIVVGKWIPVVPSSRPIDLSSYWRSIQDDAARHHLPVFDLTEENRGAVAEELSRLGVRTVYSTGPELDGFDILPYSDLIPRGPGRPAPPPTAPPQSNPAPSGTPPVVYTTPRTAPDARATAAAAGARIVDVPVPDPRATGESVNALRDNQDRAAILAVGNEFGDSAQFGDRARAAVTTPELPGGGQIVFPSRRMLALYGSPDAPALGPLGRQDLPSTIARAKKLAASYRSVSREPVIPAFEIIVTVASASPGADNQYSSVIDPAVIRPWVDAAEKAGVYVALDLQPGRTDFLTQAKRYTELLRRPNVGLALDPEWRLKPNQVHLTQIGSVGADEVNATSAWLARLVRDNGLPQKTFILHEFDANMLADRERINAARPELATIIHADGHGVPSVKMETWRRIVTDLPPGVFMGWKNFYTEDKPTFTPAQTMAVRPTPWFISYQ